MLWVGMALNIRVFQCWALLPLVLFTLVWAESAQDDLRPTVEAYWDHLVAGDLAAALAYVHPQDLNHYLKKNQAPVRSWSWVNQESLEAGRVSVRLDVQQEFQGKLFQARVAQIWERSEAGWKLRVEPPEQVARELFSPQDSKTDWPERIEFFPKLLTFYRNANRNRAVLTIRNGLEKDARVVSLRLDENRFRVLSGPGRVEPLSASRFLIEYVGGDEGEDLNSEARLSLEIDGRVQEFKIPISYNVKAPTPDQLRGRKPKPRSPPYRDGGEGVPGSVLGIGA